MTMTDRTFSNGSIVIEGGAEGTNTTIISVPNCDMSVTVLDDELPWLINVLGERHREILHERQTAADAARLLSWNTAAGEVLT